MFLASAAKDTGSSGSGGSGGVGPPENAEGCWVSGLAGEPAAPPAGHLSHSPRNSSEHRAPSSKASTTHHLQREWLVQLSWQIISVRILYIEAGGRIHNPAFTVHRITWTHFHLPSPHLLCYNIKMTVLTSDRCWPRAQLQGERIGHLNHLLLRCCDGLGLVRAAKDHRDIKSEPAGQEVEWTKWESICIFPSLYLSPKVLLFPLGDLCNNRIE